MYVRPLQLLATEAVTLPVIVPPLAVHVALPLLSAVRPVTPVLTFSADAGMTSSENTSTNASNRDNLRFRNCFNICFPPNPFTYVLQFWG